MAFKPGNTGRPKGAKGKFSSMKESIIKVYHDIGGDEAFAEWAGKKENQGEFYKIATKLLPKTIEGAGEDGAVIVRINNTAKRQDGKSGN